MNYFTVTECEFTVIPSDVLLSLKYIHTQQHNVSFVKPVVFL